MPTKGMFSQAERTFNARNLSSERVAQTFIAPDEFFELCQGVHTVVMGPRGSGKTTLFKMLTIDALNASGDPTVAALADKIPFDAIYIPSDVHWQEQLTSVSRELRQAEVAEQLQEMFSKAAVTVSILLAILDSMLKVIEFRNLRAKRSLVTFLRAIGRGWRLNGVPPFAEAYREALEMRFQDLFVLVRRLSLSKGEDPPTNELPDWVLLDYMPAVRLACEAFDNTYDGRGDRKWALCFDELELAPPWLQHRVFEEIRSTDQRFLIKVSTSPLPNIGSPVAAAPSEDYQVIRLWPHEKVAARDFTRRLATQLVSAHFGETRTLESFLGRSTVAGDDTYEPDSDVWSVFRELARKDSGFQRELQARGIDPTRPKVEASSDLKDSFLRKAKPIAYFRSAWLAEDGYRLIRTRKQAGLYHGVEDVLDIADGNPRWLITIIRELFRRSDHRVASGRVLAKLDQENALEEVAEQFFGFLRSLPDPRTRDSYGPPLDELVEQLGTAFESNVLRSPFTLNPVGSVVVEDEVSLALADSLRWAAEQGALIVVDPTERGLDTGVEGRRLRLSFLLAPKYHLPLRLFKPTSLLRCLGKATGSEVTPLQMRLDYE